MRVVVLYPVERAGRRRLSEPGRPVLRVKVHREGLRAVIEEVTVVRDGLAELVPRQRVVEVAEVMRQQRPTVLRQADRGFELAAIGDHRRRILEPRRQGQRAGRRAAGTAQDHRPGRGHAFHPVVETAHDLAVVHEEGVGEGREFGARLVIADHLGFAGEVARGHHRRPDGRW